jgi:hypothetical protein
MVFLNSGSRWTRLAFIANDVLGKAIDGPRETGSSCPLLTLTLTEWAGIVWPVGLEFVFRQA